MDKTHQKSVSGWINLYKPAGISSAKAVAIVKKFFKGNKIGHTGTLDLEAEGVLPIAIGQATKLVRVLMDAKKTYIFTVQFGTKTDTADKSGKIIDTSNYIPSKDECRTICSKFIGQIQQIPPKYSAIKINGQRSYKLALKSIAANIPPRIITIYQLKLLKYDANTASATYEVECSKGTYIRSLAEDISFSLKSLGFVIELRRTKVGIFTEQNSVNALNYMNMDCDDADLQTQFKLLKMEDVLDDIPVLDINEHEKQKVIFGQILEISDDDAKHLGSFDLIWVRHNHQIVAIGHISDNQFHVARVFI